jgi:hypothetical protein
MYSYEESRRRRAAPMLGPSFQDGRTGGSPEPCRAQRSAWRPRTRSRSLGFVPKDRQRIPRTVSAREPPGRRARKKSRSICWFKPGQAGTATLPSRAVSSAASHPEKVEAKGRTKSKRVPPQTGRKKPARKSRFSRGSCGLSTAHRHSHQCHSQCPSV